MSFWQFNTQNVKLLTKNCLNIVRRKDSSSLLHAYYFWNFNNFAFYIKLPMLIRCHSLLLICSSFYQVKINVSFWKINSRGQSIDFSSVNRSFKSIFLCLLPGQTQETVVLLDPILLWYLSVGNKSKALITLFYRHSWSKNEQLQGLQKNAGETTQEGESFQELIYIIL